MSRHTNRSLSQPMTAAPEPKVQPDASKPSCCGEAKCASHEDIAKRAYDIYLKTGRVQGQCKQNWEQAEHSLHDQSLIPSHPLPNGSECIPSSLAE